MADKILDDMEDDFDDTMSDILDDSLEETREETHQNGEKSSEKKISLFARLSSALKNGLKKIFSSTKRIIILTIGMVLLISIPVLLWLFVINTEPDPLSPMPADGVSGEISDPRVMEEETVFEDIVELEPFERIPLKTSATMGLVSLHLSIELVDPEYRKQIYAREDRIRSIVEQQVGNTTWLQLRNPDGKILLKYELIQRINTLFPKATVRNVYFTFFIMQ